MRYEAIMKRLKSLADPRAVEGMARFGINPRNTYGASMPALRRIAKEIRRDHGLAQRLWDSDIHDARILAGLVDDPKLVTERQMERWVRDFDSWDVCDQCCSNLFDKTPFAYEKALEWSARDEEFVKRAGFVLMAALSVHDKGATDESFESFLPIIKREAGDDRNFVRKAINWALRQIGKRNPRLNRKAIRTANEILAASPRRTNWVASDALRELTSDAVRTRLSRRKAQAQP
ncbi:MAG: DNA alkylation repair protein [Armatimonadota bacterium]|nr:MAG: DNA alkylation repair protein [Armatimonadota bacterium]